MSRSEVLAVLAIFVLAAVLRLGFAGVNPFASDEARVSVLALEMAREGKLASAGISNSAGSRNLPASVYVFVPPYLISTDPLVATQYVAVLNILAVMGLWWLVRRTWGAWSAGLAALFFAASPYAVFFSRNIWTQNLLAPFAVAWLLTAYGVLHSEKVGQRRLLLILTIFLAGFAFQVHLAGAALGLASAYAFFRWQWWRYPLAILLGTVLALLPLVPFVYQAACCSPELVQEYLGAEGTSTIDAQAVGFALKTALNHGWDYLAAGQLAEHGAWMLPPILSAILLSLGLFGIGRSIRRRTSDTPDSNPSRFILLELALVVLITNILLFTYHKTPVRLHYLLLLVPVFALIIGMAIQLFKTRWWYAGLSLLMLLLASLWTYQIWDSLSLVNQQVAPDGINTPLKAMRDVALALPAEGVVVMHTQSTDYYQRGEPAIWQVLLWNRPHRIVDGWNSLLLPSESAYLMTEIDGIHAFQEMQDTGIMDERLERFDPLVGAQNYYLQPYAGEILPNLMIPLEEPVIFETGLKLLGWYTRRVAHQLRVSMVYEAVSPPPNDASLREFAHIRSADNVEGEALYYGDALMPPVWEVGDRLIVIAVFNPVEDSGSYYVDIGHYSLNTEQRYSHNQGGDSLRFGVFDWSRANSGN